MQNLRETALLSLRQMQAPGRDSDVVEAGLIRAFSVRDGVVSYVLDLSQGDEEGDLRTRIAARLMALPGVQKVEAHVAAAPSDAPQDAAKTGAARRIDGVRHVVLVGSGKGGVGKSTVSANLALGLADAGLRVGLLDADIYGPSLPTMLAAHGRPVSYDGVLIPIAAQGVKTISLGMMLEADQALVWRGPILATTLTQLLHEVRWGPLDVLLVDLPPGTGDVQITLAQETVISGAVVVTTPQSVAIQDARRAIDLFQRTETPILGLIENMSTHICGNCGAEEPVFGVDGAAAEAERIGAPLLGVLPLARNVCDASEAGAPVIRSDPSSPAARRFGEICAALQAQLHIEPEDAAR